MKQRILAPGDWEWKIVLGEEANDAAALFSHGLRLTRDITVDYTDAAAVMSLLALGAEKLLKLTIGLAHLDRDEPWPSRARMIEIGHRVVSADTEARSMLDLTRGTVPGHIKERSDATRTDTVLAAALQALDRFAVKGRFYFLDSLGETPQTETAPHFLWNDMVTSIMTSDPDLAGSMRTVEGWKEGRPIINNVIATSLREWWEFYGAVWTTGVIGELAQQLSSAVRLLSH